MLRAALAELPTRTSWAQRYDELVAFHAANGHCCVPKADGALGRWVARQRELAKKGSLTPDRRERLDAIGFVWNTNEEAWEARYRQLLEWAERNGHACVPIADGDLGLWVAKQRQMKRKGKLSAERERLLDEAKFTWDTPSADWNEKFQELVRYKAVHGDCRVPFNSPDGLGWWVNTQRQARRKGKISKERQEKLDSVGFIWNPQQTARGSSTAGISGVGISTGVNHDALGASGSDGESILNRKRKVEDRVSAPGVATTAAAVAAAAAAAVTNSAGPKTGVVGGPPGDSGTSSGASAPGISVASSVDAEKKDAIEADARAAAIAAAAAVPPLRTMGPVTLSMSMGRMSKRHHSFSSAEAGVWRARMSTEAGNLGGLASGGSSVSSTTSATRGSFSFSPSGAGGAHASSGVPPHGYGSSGVLGARASTSRRAASFGIFTPRCPSMDASTMPSGPSTPGCSTPTGGQSTPTNLSGLRPEIVEMSMSNSLLPPLTLPPLVSPVAKQHSYQYGSASKGTPGGRPTGSTFGRSGSVSYPEGASSIATTPTTPLPPVTSFDVIRVSSKSSPRRPAVSYNDSRRAVSFPELLDSAFNPAHIRRSSVGSSSAITGTPYSPCPTPDGNTSPAVAPSSPATSTGTLQPLAGLASLAVSSRGASPAPQQPRIPHRSLPDALNAGAVRPASDAEQQQRAAGGFRSSAPASSGNDLVLPPIQIRPVSTPARRQSSIHSLLHN